MIQGKVRDLCLNVTLQVYNHGTFGKHEFLKNLKICFTNFNNIISNNSSKLISDEPSDSLSENLPADPIEGIQGIQ